MAEIKDCIEVMRHEVYFIEDDEVRDKLNAAIEEAASALAHLHAELDHARQTLKIANTGGLDLLYAIRTAIGWTDKHPLSLLPDECRRLKDAASSTNDERDSMDDSNWFEDPDMGAR